MTEAQTLYLQAEAVLSSTAGRDKATKKALSAFAFRALTTVVPDSIEEEGMRRAYAARTKFIQQCQAQLLATIFNPDRFDDLKPAKGMYEGMISHNLQTVGILSVIWVQLMELGDGLNFITYLAKRMDTVLSPDVNRMAKYLRKSTPLLAAKCANGVPKKVATEAVVATGNNVVVLTSVRAIKDEAGPSVVGLECAPAANP